MESSGVTGVYVSLVVGGGGFKCIYSPRFLSLGTCSIKPNWAKRWRDGWRVSDKKQDGDMARGCATK